MVKFSRELEAQLIPESKDAFVDYRQLKKHVKKIKLAFLRSSLRSSSSTTSHAGDDFSTTLLRPVHALAARFSALGHQHSLPMIDEESLFEMDLVQSREEEDFMELLEQELEKVNKFFIAEEEGLCERSETLRNQLHILFHLKQLLRDHDQRKSPGDGGIATSCKNIAKR